ncbi:hypothetical protein [Amycolatopsis sp. NPDC051903]|uniref:hypothetical protein n=1 Tax=Amycolatopsis sp. NPDC051903 TaxID=3363936 RepID=UPI0037B01AFA
MMSGITVLAALVLGTAASCSDGDGGAPPSPAPSATPAPSTPDSAKPSQSSDMPKDPNKPGDGIPNNGDGDADG